jgi:hypothetical protein
MSTRALIASIAALFLATGTAHAADNAITTTLPPAKYDITYTGLLKIWIVPLPVIEYFCRGSSHIACAEPYGGECSIDLLDSVAEGKRFDTLIDGKAVANAKINLALTLRHEIGHCNGWSDKHPDARKVKANDDVEMPKWPIRMSVGCTDAGRFFISCKVDKPWWPNIAEIVK